MNSSLSIWEAETFYAPVDVLIIGSGLLGLWSALQIISQRPAAKITIIDKGITPLGASTRNAGFACFGSPSEMLSDAKSMGEEAMWNIVEMRYKGIQKTRQHFEDSAIDYDNCGGYECFKPDTEILSEVAAKLDWLNEGMRQITGDPNTFNWCNETLSQFGFQGFAAITKNTLEGSLHSGKLVQQLTKKVQAAGVNVLTGLEALSWQRHKEFIEIETQATALRARQLLVCTNGLSAQLGNGCNELARGQVLVTEPIDALKFSGTFHFDEGYYYFRNLGNRLLIGGARNLDFEKERTDVFALNDGIQKELERFVAHHLLPHTSFKVSHRWCGIMGFTEHKQPLVQQLDENVYAAVACNGMGVALSPIIAEQIAELMQR